MLNITESKQAISPEFQDFLERFPEFGDTTALCELRKTDYGRLDEHQHVYLDYTGGNLYAESQLRKHHELLSKNVFGNPHSSNPTSLTATHLVDEARDYVLEYFRAREDYYCIFTANASGALKIVGECYPFGPKSHLLLAFDNHNSVNGIRVYAKNHGASYGYTPLNIEDLRLNEPELERNLHGFPDHSPKLFAFPAQSNVSGVKHPLSLIERAHKLGWDVLLDAAAFVPSDRLDLSIYKPDFVSISFYKIFGYPTGLGALLVRKDAFNKLKKPWFAGGTVTLASVMADGYFLDGAHAKFEDGTINYLDIPALKIGLEHINKVGIETINKRVKCFTGYLLEELGKLKHANGTEVVHIFGPQSTEARGGTLIMNFFDKEGNAYPFAQVEQEANERRISIRTGCFCNPGIDEINNCINSSALSEYFESRDKGDYRDMIAYLGRMRGAVRISVGLVTNFDDISAFMDFARSFVDR